MVFFGFDGDTRQKTRHPKCAWLPLYATDESAKSICYPLDISRIESKLKSPIWPSRPERAQMGVMRNTKRTNDTVIIRCALFKLVRCGQNRYWPSSCLCPLAAHFCHSICLRLAALQPEKADVPDVNGSYEMDAVFSKIPTIQPLLMPKHTAARGCRASWPILPWKRYLALPERQLQGYPLPQASA